MKMYVDKDNVDVLDDLFDATNSYECWACNRDDNLEIVSLTDYTKQVRKEVCEEIRNKIEQAKLIYEWKGEETTIEDILDQIQGEIKCK